MEINKLQNLVLVYKMPFALDLKDCTKQDDIGNQFIILLNGIPALLRVEREYNENASEDGVKIAPFSMIKNDRHGLMSKTKIQIWFDNQTFDNPEVDKKVIGVMTNHFFQLSLRYLNKFLMDYRTATREYWIRPLKKQDILSFKYLLLDTDGKQEIVNVLLNNTVHFNGGKEITISENQEGHLRNLLNLTNRNLADDLLLDALDNIDLGNYNNTIIQCSILFENFIYEKLAEKLSKTKLDKIKKNTKCGCLVGVYQVCKTGLKSELNLDFGESEEFDNFHKKVLKVRNDLVHGKKLETVEHQNAIDAINITMAAIKRLNSELTI